MVTVKGLLGSRTWLGAFGESAGSDTITEPKRPWISPGRSGSNWFGIGESPSLDALG